MTILIGKYEFDGPHESTADLEEHQGLYVVLHQEGENYELVHLAHSDNIRQCIELSPSAPNLTNGPTLLAALYTPGLGKRGRLSIVEDIELEFGPDDDTDSN